MRSEFPVGALLLALVFLTGCSGLRQGSGLNTVDLGGKQAPDFALVNQLGEPVRLSDLRGRVVAITFLYTSCPDVCPIITTRFGEVYDKLGDARAKVALVVVTVDPERDTPERLRQYLEAQGLQDKLLFLTGSRAEMEPVWLAYFVGVIKAKPQVGADGREGFYYVTHSNLVHLIDADGRQRVLIKNDKFTAEQLLSEVRRLLP